MTATSTPTSGAADLPEALINIAREIEAFKRDCGVDPESPIAIQNGRYMALSYKVRALAAQAITASHVQKSAELEHVTDDVSETADESNTTQAISAEPAGAWIERWHGSGGKDGHEGWSIVDASNRSLVAYLGREVDSDTVTAIVMAHNTLRASHGQAPAQQADPSITLDFKQASELLEMFGGEAGLMTLQRGGAKCHSGPGLYAWYSDVPEEGAEFLGTEPDDKATPQAADTGAAQGVAVLPDCDRCKGSGEDPEGFYDQSRGPDGATHDGPCRSCGGSGAAQGVGITVVGGVNESQDDSLLLCASDLQHSAIYDNHVEMQSCIRAVADRITALAAPQPAPPADSGAADAARLDFLCDPARLHMVECEKAGLWRVYQDEAPADDVEHHWQAMTSLWHPTARSAIDAARKQGGQKP